MPLRDLRAPGTRAGRADGRRAQGSRCSFETCGRQESVPDVRMVAWFKAHAPSRLEGAGNPYRPCGWLLGSRLTVPLRDLWGQGTRADLEL